MNALTVIQQPAVPSFTMGEIERIALAIAKGGAFGSNDPNAVLTLCLLAQAEGKHPAIVFRDYHVIQGKPAKKADAMLSDFLASGGRVEWHALTDDLADATFTHPAGGTIRISWDKQRVAQAQLGGNPMHKKYPRQMLRSRVISEGVRTVFPGATSGLYVPEEVQDFAPAAAPTPPMPQAKRARDLPQIDHSPGAALPAAAIEPPSIDAGLQTGAASTGARQTPAEWTEAFTERLNQAQSRDDVIAMQTKAEKALAKLGDTEPTLYALAIEAIKARAASFDDGGDADEPGEWRGNVLAAG